MRLITLFLVFFTATCANAANIIDQRFTVTSINLKYFGIGGSPRGVPADETRYESIKRHLTDNGLLTDVIAFQEVVDVDGLKSRVLGPNYWCASYSHSDAKHIHVAICTKTQFRFYKAQDDSNYALENVGMRYYRPAVHGVLKTLAGEPIAHIVAVHLKAGTEYSETRIDQMDMIAKYLRFRTQDVPVVLTGDFNTHENDVRDFTDVLQQEHISASEIEIADEYTFRVPEVGFKFDRYWVDDRLRVISAPRVVGPCNGPATTTEITRYNREVSDHCGVKMELEAKIAR